ncbi:MAG: sn-glycerol-3-phosphate ABC transporter ATP-binding protein UgpC [Phycisphaerales bacterium]|nr:sn-glycerol-3-phosphate ABC transporter ATP-binding protein UgpC [Phycisphaerales bacterium]
MSKVELSGVWKIYDKNVEAVRDVNLAIDSGEFVVLVGPSGCGKSTTLRMIAGLETVSRGQISIGDRVVNDVAPKDRNIAMVFQNYALYPHMTVEKNIAFALKIAGMPKDEIAKRVARTSSILGLDALLKRKPGALSGGQRQRVALGRAIARDPAVYLFDEPLSNLDAKLRVSMRSELKALHQRLGTTTVYVTHDQEEAMTLGSRLVVMAESEVQQIGTPLEVYQHPVNRFVAGFVGSPTMNFIPGRIESGLFRAKAGSFQLPVPASALAGEQATGEIVLGFRPQAVVAGESSPGAFEAKVELTEPLGDQVDLRLDIGAGETIGARMPMTSIPSAGQTMRVAIKPEDVMLFEPGEFGRRLGAPKPASKIKAG